MKAIWDQVGRCFLGKWTGAPCCSSRLGLLTGCFALSGGKASSAELDAFMKTWAQYEAFQVPMDPKDEPLLLAALEQNPTGPWAAYISMKFAQTTFEARSLDTAGRAALYGASLRYLMPARDTLARAAEAKPHDKNLRHNLIKIKEHISLASLEAGLDLAEAKESSIYNMNICCVSKLLLYSSGYGYHRERTCEKIQRPQAVS